jgi:hypothetical protein
MFPHFLEHYISNWFNRNLGAYIYELRICFVILVIINNYLKILNFDLVLMKSKMDQ